MGKRLYIPAMKREILYLVVEKAIVDNNINTEDEVAVISELEGPFKDDSGYHFVISRGGHVICDRQLQRPADAVNYYNAEGIVVGYVLTQDETGAQQKINAAQVESLHTVLKVLNRVFPKATVKVMRNNALEQDVKSWFAEVPASD
jgi:hypothetical protein